MVCWRGGFGNPISQEHLDLVVAHFRGTSDQQPVANIVEDNTPPIMMVPSEPTQLQHEDIYSG